MSLKYAYYSYITLMRLAGRVLRRRASDLIDLIMIQKGSRGSRGTPPCPTTKTHQ